MDGVIDGSLAPMRGDQEPIEVAPSRHGTDFPRLSIVEAQMMYVYRGKGTSSVWIQLYNVVKLASKTSGSCHELSMSVFGWWSELGYAMLRWLTAHVDV